MVLFGDIFYHSPLAKKTRVYATEDWLFLYVFFKSLYPHCTYIISVVVIAPNLIESFYVSWGIQSNIPAIGEVKLLSVSFLKNCNKKPFKIIN